MILGNQPDLSVDVVVPAPALLCFAPLSIVEA